MQNFAVIGHPITHSLSPLIHQQFALQHSIKLNYERVDITSENCTAWIRQFFRQGGNGLNVTLPLKEIVLSIADVIHTHAETAKAANTLWVHKKQIHADNTDGVGFLRDLQRYINLTNSKVLILGAGGATRGILEPLLQSGVHSVYVSNRSENRAHQLKTDFPAVHLLPWTQLEGSYEVIINATAAGHSHSHLPLQSDKFSEKPFAYDLSYKRNADTPFVQQCRAFGWESMDGLGMLVEQAAESFYIWHGVRPDTQTVLQLLRQQGHLLQE